MNTIIYYFSGTGNSLHVARELQRRLPACALVPIVALLDQEEIRTEADTVGFVFPIYLTTVPAPVREFIEKLDMGAARYVFVAATRIGTFVIAPTLMRRLLKKKGKTLDACFLLNMASNSPTGIKPGKGDEGWVERIREEELAKIEARIKPQLDEMAAIIKNRRPYPKRGLPNPLHYLTYLVLDPITRNTSTEVGYYVDDTCNSCGTCERVCLSDKIAIVDGRPMWQEDVACYYCFACFNFCPQQAILVRKKYDEKRGRYHHPDVGLDDIAGQKELSTE